MDPAHFKVEVEGVTVTRPKDYLKNGRTLGDYLDTVLALYLGSLEQEPFENRKVHILKAARKVGLAIEHMEQTPRSDAKAKEFLYSAYRELGNYAVNYVSKGFENPNLLSLARVNITNAIDIIRESVEG